MSGKLGLLTVLAIAASAVALASCEEARVEPRPRVVVLYSYSSLDAALEQGVLPAFRRRWQETSGERLEFVTTFAGSGVVTNRIIEKYPAEIAILSSELDAYRLAYAAIGWRSWHKLPHRGVLGRTPLVIVVREGNPLGIRDFGDLGRQGVRILHADPLASGAAKWSILAVYGSALRQSGDREAAFESLLGLWKNVSARAASARELHQRFEAGEGDALITYEQDVLASPTRPAIRGEIVYPRATILCEPVVARIDKNISGKQRPVIDAFVEFLWSPEAQRLLVGYGLRSADGGLDGENPALGRVEDPFTLESLGGAVTARREILEAVWRDRALPLLAAP